MQECCNAGFSHRLNLVVLQLSWFWTLDVRLSLADPLKSYIDMVGLPHVLPDLVKAKSILSCIAEHHFLIYNCHLPPPEYYFTTEVTVLKVPSKMSVHRGSFHSFSHIQMAIQ
jgi:hypothetical protein